MREVHVTREQFDEFLYPAIASSSAENESELETAVRVLRKLKKPDITFEEVISSEEQERAKKNRTKLVPFRKLTVDEHTFMFEEPEYKLVLDRVKAHLPRISLAAAEELWEFYESVKGAPEVNIEKGG